MSATSQPNILSGIPYMKVFWPVNPRAIRALALRPRNREARPSVRSSLAATSSKAASGPSVWYISGCFGPRRRRPRGSIRSSYQQICPSYRMRYCAQQTRRIKNL